MLNRNSTDQIISICNELFNPKECNELARKCDFIKRSSSKLKGDEFLKMLILPTNDLSEDSLDGLCLRIKEFNPEADLSASALAQRINTTSAVSYIKACMQKILHNSRMKILKQNEGVLKYFENIFIQDSTVFELNKHLHKAYPGTKRGGKKGGSSCKAQMKIDLIHNFSKGTIEDVKIYAGKLPDQALSEQILKVIKVKDLVIRDLGYFKIEIFKRIAVLGAYYLSRFPSHVKVYLSPDAKEAACLSTYFKKKHKNSFKIDLNVWIGEERLPVRLVAYKVPSEISKERRRITHKKAKEMGRTTSKEKLNLLEYSLFITNIPAEIVSVEVIGTVYRLRWEIELIFKQWKQLLKIDVIKGIYQERIDCLILGRLCMVILIASVTSSFMNLVTLKRELSPTKLIKFLLRNDRLFRAVKSNKLEDLVEEIFQNLSRRLLKNKRDRKTMRERAFYSEPYYGVAACF